MATTMTVQQLSHLQRVRLLYKTILRLHRGLPENLQILGDAYVKEEFRRHKSASPVQTVAFMEAWASYALTITKQVGVRGPVGTDGKFGIHFKTDDLNKFSDEQLVQLYDLYQETTQSPKHSL